MALFQCARCGEAHELSELEPSYARPDAFFDIPEAERAQQANFSKSEGRIRDAADRERWHFLRVRLPVPVRGEERPCGWGVWVEVDGAAWARAAERWDDPAQSDEPPFRGVLANELKGFTGARGLAGAVQLTGPTTVPEFRLDAAEHPLARDQQEGVPFERAAEWVALHH